MPRFQLDKALIRELGQLLDETNLTEIEISEGNKSVRVSRAASTTIAAAAPAVSAPVAAPAADSAPPAAASDASDHPGALRSPMVGTAYLSPEPGAAPFVQVGDTVSEGQTLLIIEAMKVMNQIPAPKAGVIKQIMIDDAQPVEYGDVLVILE